MTDVQITDLMHTLWSMAQAPGTIEEAIARMAEETRAALTEAAPTLPDGVTPDDGMNGKYIERRIERWYFEGLHGGRLSKCPYEEGTHAERWWMRGCDRAERMQDTKRLDWYFGTAPKGDWLATYLAGMQADWTLDQWRAAIDDAIRGTAK